MFALTRRLRGDLRIAGAASGEGPVLPRLLRKPARYLGRWFTGNVDLPRNAGAIANGGFLGLALLYGALAGGHGPAVVQASTAMLGFSIRDLSIVGQHETSEAEIAAALGLGSWTSLIGFDVEAARESLQTLPWVETATVRKAYPSGLDIALVERKAVAIWQHGDELSLIDATGKTIAAFDNDRFSGLPLVIGAGAERAAGDLLPLLAANSAISGRVIAHIRVGERRWDLRLDNGVTVRLPETKAGEALATLAQLDEENGVLDRDIDAVDLRLADRVAFELTDSGAAARAEAVKDAIAVEKKRRRT